MAVGTARCAVRAPYEGRNKWEPALLARAVPPARTRAGTSQRDVLTKLNIYWASRPCVLSIGARLAAFSLPRSSPHKWIVKT
jgi:hypothetical protein